MDIIPALPLTLKIQCFQKKILTMQEASAKNYLGRGRCHFWFSPGVNLPPIFRDFVPPEMEPARFLFGAEPSFGCAMVS